MDEDEEDLEEWEASFDSNSMKDLTDDYVEKE